MIKNYLVTAIRHLVKQKTFSLINIFGLAIGLTAGFFIWQYVRFEHSYDDFHTNANRIYRIGAKFYHHTTEIGTGASVSPPVAINMKEDFPEVVAYARLAQTSLFTSDIGSYVANALDFAYHKPDGSITSFHEERVYFADEALLTIFSFPLQSGTPDALREPNAVVITESTARKYFGDGPVLGKELRLNGEVVLRVTGVLEDLPANSHLQFDILISFPTVTRKLKDFDTWWQWGVCYSYILTSPGVDVAAIDPKIPAFMRKYLGEEMDREYHTRFFLQPIKDIHLNQPLAGEQSAPGDRWTVYFLSILAVFILVVAWINYFNLTTARSLDRSKEVSLRKVVGAQRKQLIIQFLCEAGIVNLSALVLMALLVAISWPAFDEVIGKHILKNSWSTIFSDPYQWLVLFLVVTAGIFMAGLYPAIILSSFTPAKALKGVFTKTSGIGLRKLMVSFQYWLAMLLVAGTMTIYMQLGFMRSQDPGFVKDQMLVVGAPAAYDSTAGDKIAFFRNNVSALSGVNRITASTDVPGRQIVEYFPVGKKGGKDDEAFATYISSIDEDFLTAYGIKLLQGRIFSDNERMNFRRQSDDESIKVLVNEEFVRQLREQDLKQALNTNLVFWWGPDLRFAEIIGVVSDHHQVSLKEKVQPVMFVQPGWTAWKYFSVHVAAGNFERTIASVKEAYTQAFPGSSFEYFFLDDFFDRQYHNDQQLAGIMNVFTILAILVTCLGLIGLGIFTVSHRVKEIGIRKSLGATPRVIVFLFVKDFLRISLLAYLFALPAMYFASNWWLANFSFHIPLMWQIFLVPVVLLSATTILTICSIALPSALANPVRALRSE